MEKTALIVHGHFYQPPRENPWTHSVERQPGARPFDNWNERIHFECYRPNAYARVVDAYGRVERIVNNYARINFNFGATLLNWLERHHPETYASILAADRTSARERGGHGNAIAQGYHHSILPLCNERDRLTEIRWGVAGFKHRFRRDPESLWLPETACDDATLGALIDEGLAYVILSPFQAARVRSTGARVWESVADGLIDTTVPYRYFHRDGSNRSIAIFFYDGQLAKSVAFDGVLASSHLLVERFVGADARGGLVHIATDGETYGHHFKFGDRCLAYALEVEAPARGFRVTNYGEYLEEHQPEWEVELRHDEAGEGTAWSCAHGLGRWARDCSCHAGAPEGWNQRWRDPLRRALNFLRDAAAAHFERQGGDLFRDVWRARDDYVSVLGGAKEREQFLREHATHALGDADETRALTLLEMQRASLMMFTSCGWFFNDISGIETVQVLRYAARVVELLDELEAASPRAQFLELLAEAMSNDDAHGNGADIFRAQVEASRVSPRRVAASLAISGLVAAPEAQGQTAGYDFARTGFERQQNGRLALATERLKLESRATGRRYDFAAASMHFGDVDFYCALRAFENDSEFAAASRKLREEFRASSLPRLLRLVREEFGPDEYGLEHLLPQGRRGIYEIVFGQMIERFTEQYEFLYEENRRNIEMLQEAGFELPSELRAAAEFTVGRRFELRLQRLEQEPSPATLGAAVEIADEIARLGYRLDRARTRRQVGRLITRAVSVAVASPASANLEAAFELIRVAHKLGLDADVERAQEIAYEAVRRDASRVALRGLALTLGLSPVLFEKTGTEVEPGGENMAGVATTDDAASVQEQAQV
jgi:alpha-amylase/alpha-mannosidase (GH57 family)